MRYVIPLAAIARDYALPPGHPAPADAKGGSGTWTARIPPDRCPGTRARRARDPRLGGSDLVTVNS